MSWQKLWKIKPVSYKVNCVLFTSILGKIRSFPKYLKEGTVNFISVPSSA